MSRMEGARSLQRKKFRGQFQKSSSLLGFFFHLWLTSDSLPIHQSRFPSLDRSLFMCGKLEIIFINPCS